MGGNFLVLTILISLWIALCLFYWQHRECCAVQKRERKLRKINDEMTCFVYGAAHDLKAPLRAIMQIGARLGHELHVYMDAGQRDDMALLQQRASRMSVLIDDLLAYWQAGQKNSYAHNRSVDMAALAYEIVAMLSPPPEFNIIIEAPLRKMAVRYMPMQQVLLNLVGNALKHHGGDKGVIRIGGTDEGRHYIFFVADDGQGIPDEYKQKIFEPFERLRSRDEIEGSGLGLSLVKKIIERQNGDIIARDAQAGGAVFSMTWPKKERD